MSLKGFHIVFITFSTLLALGVGGLVPLGESDRGCAGLSGGSGRRLSARLALMVYGVWFYRKMKRLRIIT